MFEMQTFHQWLSTTPSTPDAHRQRLLHLQHASRARVLEATSQTAWFIWSAEEAPETTRN